MAESAKHTPGPWRAVLGIDQMADLGTTVHHRGKWGVYSDAPTHGDEEADAHLIAATPDLLMVAQFLVNTIHSVENRCMAADGPVTPTCDEITDDELQKLYYAALAAITKAGSPA